MGELKAWGSALAEAMGLPDPNFHSSDKESKDSKKNEPKPGSLEDWQKDSSRD